MTRQVADALYQLVDPAKPLPANAEGDRLYVDWARELGDDVMSRLERGLVSSGDLPAARLLTGHRGSGKTTELNRLRARLESGPLGGRYFVSVLQADDLLDLRGVRGQSVLFAMVRQLVTDLDGAGVGVARSAFDRALGALKGLLQAFTIDWSLPFGLGISLALKDVVSERDELQRALERAVPSLVDTVNRDVLVPARAELAAKRGARDIVLVVDQLDRIPADAEVDGRDLQRLLFVDDGRFLRGLHCKVLLTTPIELCESRARNALAADFGEIYDLPSIPVRHRNDEPNEAGLAKVADILERRFAGAGLATADVFDDPAWCTRLCLASGGYVRALFMLLRSALERNRMEVPLPGAVLERALFAAADDADRSLRERELDVLRAVHATKDKPRDAEAEEVFYALVRDRYVFSYDDERGRRYYDWYPVFELLEA